MSLQLIAMASGTRDTQEQAARWLATWQRAGAALDEERLRRLRDMTVDEARERTRQLLALWRSAGRDEGGAELVIHQRCFSAATRASRAR